MDQLELAESSYRRIMQRRPGEWADFSVRELHDWLSDDVLHAIGDLIDRPTFRKQACWPLAELSPGAQTPVRTAVEAVDAALVGEARALKKLAGGKRIAQALAEMRPPVTRPLASSVTISSQSIEVTRRMQTFDDLQSHGEQIRRIAGRPWTDLVCAEDYFQPRGGLMLRRSPGLTEGSFVAAINPELHPIGDFVTRCMIRRVEIWRGILGRFRRWCLDAARRVDGENTASAISERRACEDLESAAATLHTLCSADRDAGVRDSCVILTQVYAAFHPQPCLSWLGLPEAPIAEDAGVLRHRVANARDAETTDRIAAALGALRGLYGDSPPDLPARDEAIATGGLVLLKGAREAHWEAERIEHDWNHFDRSWSLLVALAEKASLRAGVSVGDIYGDAVVTESALSTLQGRLKKMLPASLRSLIRPTGQGSYRLHLDRGKVHVLP